MKGMTEDELVGWHHWFKGVSLSKVQEIVKDREAWHAAVCGSQRVEHDLAIEQRICVYYNILLTWMFLSLIVYPSCFPADSDRRVCLQCVRPRFDPWVGKILSRRKWQPTRVFLPGKSHGGCRSLVGHSPWHCKESDTTEWLTLTPTHQLSFLWHSAGLSCHHFLCCCLFIFYFAPLVNANTFHIMHANPKAEWHTEWLWRTC